MPLSPAPTGPTDWATVLQNNGPLGGPNRIDPSTARQQAGWYWGDKPDYETLNGWMYNMSQKIDWAVSGIETHDTQIGGLGSTFGVDENNMSTIAFPAGGTFSNSGNVTGAFKIALPNSWTDTRMRFIIDVFEEDNGVTSSILVSGYNLTAGTQWTDTQGSNIAGNKTHRVRFAHDGTVCAIILGSITDTWISPHVRIRAFTGHGGSSWQYTNWVSGWAISTVVTETGLTFTGNDLEIAPLGSPTWNTETPTTINLTLDGTHDGDLVYLGSGAVANRVITLKAGPSNKDVVWVANQNATYTLTINDGTDDILLLMPGEIFKLTYSSVLSTWLISTP